MLILFSRKKLEESENYKNGIVYFVNLLEFIESFLKYQPLIDKSVYWL